MRIPGKQVSADPELDFPNDQLADWVMQTEASFTMKENEVSERRDNIDGKVTDAFAPLRFPVSFTYNGIFYNAQVCKTHIVNSEYHITSVNPAVPYLPDTFVITVTDEEKLEFPVNETWYPLFFGLAITEAIKRECRNRNIVM